jgi:hypothetical protein
VDDSTLQIPSAVFESLAVVLDLSDEEFAGLLSALDDPDVTDLEDVTRALASSRSSPSVGAGELIESFVALNRLRETHGWPAARAAERIAQSDAAPVTSDQEMACLRRRVHALLETPGVAVPAGPPRRSR